MFDELIGKDNHVFFMPDLVNQDIAIAIAGKNILLSEMCEM
jgi:hypothetical protein